MKILVLADEPDKMLWDYLDKRRLEGIDLVISCGDLSPSYLSFLTCFTPAPILYVHGNHDTRYERKPPEGCICVEDDIYVYKGVKILGLGGCMKYRPSAHQYTDWDMKWRVIKLIPKMIFKGGFDILVTHAPAKGIGDSQDLAHRGFEVFITLMKWFKPKFLLHGHVHQSYTRNSKKEMMCGDTTLINVCGTYILEIPDPPADRLPKDTLLTRLLKKTSLV
jgi:predicted phosphodiesterase